jgi:hypothetical protein
MNVNIWSYSIMLYSRLVKIESESESESYVTTDSRSDSLSWNKAPIWGLWPDINYCLTIMVLFLWDALSDERTGLYFVYATGPHQCSPSWDRGPLVSRPYFTVSDLRLPFLSPPTTCRGTVEVFDPASTRVFRSRLIQKNVLYTHKVITIVTHNRKILQLHA